MIRRQLLTALGAATLLGALAVPAYAQDYPVKPVTLIIPWTAGGPTDVAMRAIAEVASKHLGQPIIVENKAGGGGALGPATMAATAKPDGYTIAQIPIGVYRLPIMQETTWDPLKDFTYIVHLTGYVFATFASEESGFKTWSDVVAFAKKNPGKVSYATPGAGTSLHIGMEQMAAKEGIKLTHVPFKGASEVNVAVAGNHTMLGASGLSAKPLADAGKLRFLTIWAGNRVKLLPDVPTLKEVGLPFVFDSPFGLAGPKGMDPKVVAKLHDAFKRALEDPSVLATFEKYEMVPNYLDSADYTKFVQDFMVSERKALTDIGLAKK
ncbi:tripartite tricarboxylate transporter substrate binding protein [Bradyrhizobium sp. LHD-71]|uniref:Bug family tripartite tricarboxylate transporter substrate binding protein n=1 Tax=Bradyrhizobium sp. LHD-71 TaxID=3072141 RepID=UPI00280D3EB1|nr:tripartite tricarboxylate transporter substrate binding protein [Bradyrhizobium sp. LHD-71]MDQ8728381.1 tripartite tricarboxylate transporter substrate binding protein [Bradyrhizobium sp. LHD-71]